MEVHILRMGMMEAPDQPKGNEEAVSHTSKVRPILQALNSQAVATTGTHVS